MQDTFLFFFFVFFCVFKTCVVFDLALVGLVEWWLLSQSHFEWAWHTLWSMERLIEEYNVVVVGLVVLEGVN